MEKFVEKLSEIYKLLGVSAFGALGLLLSVYTIENKRKKRIVVTILPESVTDSL